MIHELFRACRETPPCGTSALAGAAESGSASRAAVSAVNIIKCGPVKTPMFRSGHQFAINVDRSRIMLFCCVSPVEKKCNILLTVMLWEEL